MVKFKPIPIHYRHLKMEKLEDYFISYQIQKNFNPEDENFKKIAKEFFRLLNERSRTQRF